MNITAGTGRYCPQKIPSYDNIGRGSADSMRSLRCNAAGTIGAKPTAYPLKAKSAFNGLPLHTVVGRFHRKSCNIILQRLICAFAGCTTVTMIHVRYLLLIFVVGANALFKVDYFSPLY